MQAEKKRRIRAHVNADIAVKYVQWICARAGFTTSDSLQGADYGIDVSMQTFNRAGEAETEEVLFQVKAATRLRRIKGGRIAFTVDKRDLRNWLEKPSKNHRVNLRPTPPFPFAKLIKASGHSPTR